ncbi:hypothetical protein B0H12DRAFT_1242860 [Mycena haematopus]|nr:hypothetical protein B0H12DRAFT_1242860 [Mycena haematopus]
MQRAPHAREAGPQLFQAAGLSAEEVFQNVPAVTANRIHRDLAPPTLHAQAETMKKFQEFIPVAMERPEFLHLDLNRTFDAAAPLLPLNCIIAFMNYICLSSRGSIADRITVVTLQNKIGLFLGLTTRLTGRSYSSEITQQLYAYADGECCRTFALSRDVRVKPVADKVDISRILQQLWHPSHSTQSTRMRHQLSFCIKKAAFTTSRPGQDVESSAAGYRDQNEGLEYRDLEFVVNPPRTDGTIATRSRLSVKVTARLQKGKRDKLKTVLTLVFLSEPVNTATAFSGPGYCIVADLIVMAMHDEVFLHVPDFASLAHLMKAMKPGQAALKLQYKDGVSNLPVLRAYTDATHYTISNDKVLKYSTIYKQYETLGKLAGFEEKFGPYCLRRMGANNLEESAAVTSAQRTQMMGHNQFSRIFQTNYMNNLVQLDLSAIAAGRAEDRESIKSVGRMSMNADMQAPIALSPAGLQTVLSVDEVQEARAALEEQNLGLVEAEQGVRTRYRAFRAVFLRHQRAVFADERRQWFKNADQRMMQNVATPRTPEAGSSSVDEQEQWPANIDPALRPTHIEPVSILAEEEEEEDIENLDVNARLEKFQDIDFNNLTQEQLAMLIREGGYEEAMRAHAIALQSRPDVAPVLDAEAHTNVPADAPHERLPRGTFTRTIIQSEPVYDPVKHLPFDIIDKLFFGGFADDGSVDAQIAVWDFLFSLPERPILPMRRFEISTYQGEYANVDGTCPRPKCKENLLENKYTNSKRAIHLHQCYREMKQTESNAASQRRYPNLPLAECPVEDCPSAPDTFEGFVQHIRAHHMLRKDCRISDCGERFNTNSDLMSHIELVHAIPSPTAYLMFCYFCHTWSFNQQADFKHREIHFLTEWEPLRLCSPAAVAAPIGECPGYATEIDTGLVRNPGICPFCLWDPELYDLQDGRWMHQETAGNLETHIMNHHHEALVDQRSAGHLLACPCQMCPESQTPTLNLLELYNHLIVVHRIALQGKRKAKSGDGKLHPLAHLRDLKKPSNAAIGWVPYGVDIEDKMRGQSKTPHGDDGDTPLMRRSRRKSTRVQSSPESEHEAEEVVKLRDISLVRRSRRKSTRVQSSPETSESEQMAEVEEVLKLRGQSKTSLDDNGAEEQQMPEVEDDLNDMPVDDEPSFETCYADDTLLDHDQENDAPIDDQPTPQTFDADETLLDPIEQHKDDVHIIEQPTPETFGTVKIVLNEIFGNNPVVDAQPAPAIPAATEADLVQMDVYVDDAPAGEHGNYDDVPVDFGKQAASEIVYPDAHGEGTSPPHVDTFLQMDAHQETTSIDLCTLLEGCSIPPGTETTHLQMLEYARLQQNVPIPRTVMENGLDNETQAQLDAIIDYELKQLDLR